MNKWLFGTMAVIAICMTAIVVSGHFHGIDGTLTILGITALGSLVSVGALTIIFRTKLK